jgi:oligopeptide transport system substrate-binding protein
LARQIANLAALAGLLVLTACGFSPLPVDLTIANDSEPTTLDPALMTGVSEGRIAAALFEGLTTLDPDTHEARPAVAESWTVSRDGREYVFRLRDDARWSDGNPVTATDYRYSWLRVLSPGTGAAYAGLLFPVRGAKAYHGGEGPPEKVGIRATDDRTLSVTLDRPIPYFPSLTAFFTLLPVPRHAVEKHGDRWTRPENMVGNGPFVLKSWRFYREIVLQRNPTHRTRPGVDRIRLLPIVDANTQFNLYSTGVADVTFSVPDPIVHRLAGRPDFVTGPRLSTSFIRLNVRRKPLDNKIFRHAIALAIDREAITSRVTRGGETPTRSLVPPVLPGYDPHPGLVGGAKIARHTLETAGVGQVRPLAILLPENPDYAVLAGVVAHQLKETLGLEVRLDIREWKVYLAARRRGDYDLALSRWIGDYPDPTTFLDCFRSGDGNNQTGFADATYDRLLAEAADSATDRRSATLRAAEGRLLSLAPIVPLFHPTTRFMVSERVRGFRPNVMGIVRFADLSVGDR